MSRKNPAAPAPQPGEPFTVTLRNRRNWSIELHLGPECVSEAAGLPETPGIRARQSYNELEMHRPPVTVFEPAKFPPTLTLLAKETRTGLPEGVALAKSVITAAAQGDLLVSKVAVQSVDKAAAKAPVSIPPAPIVESVPAAQPAPEVNGSAPAETETAVGPRKAARTPASPK